MITNFFLFNISSNSVNKFYAQFYSPVYKTESQNVIRFVNNSFCSEKKNRFSPKSFSVSAGHDAARRTTTFYSAGEGDFFLEPDVGILESMISHGRIKETTLWRLYYMCVYPINFRKPQNIHFCTSIKVC